MPSGEGSQKSAEGNTVIDVKRTTRRMRTLVSALKENQAPTGSDSGGLLVGKVAAIDKSTIKSNWAQQTAAGSKGKGKGKPSNSVVLNLEAGTAAAAVDHSLLVEAKPESAAAAGADAVKPRLPHDEVIFILMMKSDSCESDSPELKRWDAEFEQFQERVRQEYMAKGYVEVDEDYFERRNARHELLAKECEDLDFSRFPTANYMEDEHLRSLIQFPWED